MSETLFDKTRGIRGRVKHSQCHHHFWVIENYEHKECPDCIEELESKGSSFYVPDMKPFFNRGLGMVTNGTRHAEQIAKKRGLTPIEGTDFKKVARKVWPNHPLTRSLDK